MNKRTAQILRKANRLANAWEDESLSACGHGEFVQKALYKRQALFEFLKTEIEQLVREIPSNPK